MNNHWNRQSQGSDAPPPRWLWPVTLAGVGTVVLVTLVGALLIALGAADPPVAGPVIWSDRALAWASGPHVSLEAGQGEWWAAPAGAILPDGAVTLEVQARLSGDGDPSAAWGVWLERPDGARVIYALSGEGYITTRVCAPHQTPLAIEDCPALRPEWRWMPYPRVKLPGESNTITLHQETSGDLRLRLNGEILGAAPVARSGRWGVWARGGRERAAVLTWQRAALRAKS